MRDCGDSNNGDLGVIVNSYYHKNSYNSDGSVKSVTEYTGSNFDNNGVNPFTDLFNYNGNPAFKFNDANGQLSFTYKLIPIDKTKQVISEYSGSGKIDMSSEDWCKINYSTDYAVKMLDTGEKVVPSSLKLNISERNVPVGDYLQINADVLPVKASDRSLNWTSDNPSVVEVLQTGLVFVKVSGKAMITCRTNSGDLAVQAVINGYKEIEKVTISKSIVLKVKENSKSDYTIMPEDAFNKDVTWSSSNSDIVSVDENGVVTGVSEGKAVVTCKSV